MPGCWLLATACPEQPVSHRSSPAGDAAAPHPVPPAFIPDARLAAPQALGSPKVALLFLAKGPMPHEGAWRLWLSSAAGLLPARKAQVGCAGVYCMACLPAEGGSCRPAALVYGSEGMHRSQGQAGREAEQSQLHGADVRAAHQGGWPAQRRAMGCSAVDSCPHIPPASQAAACAASPEQYRALQQACTASQRPSVAAAAAAAALEGVATGSIGSEGVVGEKAAAGNASPIDQQHLFSVYVHAPPSFQGATQLPPLLPAVAAKLLIISCLCGLLMPPLHLWPSCSFPRSEKSACPNAGCKPPRRPPLLSLVLNCCRVPSWQPVARPPHPAPHPDGLGRPLPD